MYLKKNNTCILFKNHIIIQLLVYILKHAKHCYSYHVSKWYKIFWIWIWNTLANAMHKSCPGFFFGGGGAWQTSVGSVAWVKIMLWAIATANQADLPSPAPPFDGFCCRVARFGLFEAKKWQIWPFFYIGWPGHFLEFIKYLAFLKVYRRFYSKIKTFSFFKTYFGIFR